MKKNLKMMVVVGEASGDGHAASLLRALREGYPSADFTFFGSAGSELKKEGVEALVDAADLAIIGGLEIARKLPMFWRAFRKLRTEAIARRPDAVVLVDFPDFNLRLARSLKRKGFRIIYYISPQVWAWKKFRVRTIKKHVDLLISILPFEKEFYLKMGFDRVEYVGNPVAEDVRPKAGRDEFRAKYDIGADSPLVALLPGSRRVEVERIFPDLLKAAKLIRKKVLGVRFVIPLASTRSKDELDLAASDAGIDARDLEGLVTVVSGETYDAVAASDAAAVASGTATLETGVLGTPMVVVYKASALNYFLLRPLISIDTFGLVNLVAGRRLATELIQGDLNPERLAEEVIRLLDPDENRRIREELRGVRTMLSGADASRKAADLVMAEIGR